MLKTLKREFSGCLAILVPFIMLERFVEREAFLSLGVPHVETYSDTSKLHQEYELLRNKRFFMIK